MDVRLPGFQITSSDHADTHVIRVKGELDLFDSPRLAEALEVAEASPARRILVDVDELTFIDSAGLHILLDATRPSASTGGRLQITPGRGPVAALFRMMGLHLNLRLPLAEPAQPKSEGCVLASATVAGAGSATPSTAA